MAETPTPPEPIAVIGMGCRFSGEASSVEGFWAMLRSGRKQHGRVPASRYEASAWEHPSHERKAAINHDSGFFIEEDPGLFDAPFFSITSKEAAGMDPVQRLLLEVAYEAFENAGVPMESLPRSATGVYSGCMTNDYELLSTRDIMDMPHNSATGNGRTMLANRLSWFFDLRGPSIMMDTACSSSLTALHLATQALRTGECSQAIVTGASLILHPNFTQRLSSMHMLSADGISHSFDSRANGYGRGEGIGAVVLKPLSQALADGDAIRAIIRGTGSNQDGRTPGITMPNADSQADLIRATYQKAGLSMRDTPYFEAHGTGTPIGDPTELSAIGASFGVERKSGHEPLYVGSVKSNIGHTEGAAGVASLIKVILCLEKGMLVPNAGFSHLNPKIRLEEWGLRLSDATIPWPAHLPQRASINSFGFGGANAHAILESAAQYFGRSQPSVHVTPADRTPQIVVFSTYDKAGLDRTAARWTSYLNTPRENPLSLPDIAHTMATRRSKLAFRSFAVADSLETLQATLSAGLPSFPRASRTNQTPVAFICTGQGAQWARMGLELLANPIFAASVDRSQQVLHRLGCPWNLVDEIRADATTSCIHRPDRSQPICCALQIALVDMLFSWEVFPKAVVGHSSGEVGAAYAAGYLTHDDAMQITYFRGVFSQQMADSGPRGGMLAAGISAADAQPYLQTLRPDAVVVACVNSPSSITLSGDLDAITRLETRLQADGHFARRLRVATAYHSPHMRALADAYQASIAGITPITAPTRPIAMFSSVTKALIQPADLDAAYWVRNLVSPVQFAAAVTQLAAMTEAPPPSAKGRSRRRATPVKWGAFLEIGPHDALKAPFTQTVQPVAPALPALPYHALVRRNEPALRTALHAVAVLWSVGCSSINLPTANRSLLPTAPNPQPPQLTPALPPYAWNHTTRFWHEPLESALLRQRTAPRHDLLGVPWEYQNDAEPRWRNFLRVSELPWLADHVVAGSIVYPAAGMVAMVAEAARQMAHVRQGSLAGVEFQDLEFVRGLVIPEDDRGLEVALHVAPHRGVEGWYEFGLFSLPEGQVSGWVQHARGGFMLRYAPAEAEVKEDWVRMAERVARMKAGSGSGSGSQTAIEDVYRWLSETGGVTLGPTFRSMVGVAFDADAPRVHVRAVVPDTKSTMPHGWESACVMHPTSLDALFQAAVVAGSDGLTNHQARIPVGVDRLYLSTGFSLQPGDPFEVLVETGDEHGASRFESIAAHPSWHQPGVVLRGVRLGPVPMQSGTAGSEEENEVVPSRYSSLDWAEHVDSVGAGEKGLRGWVERVCHTHGDGRALVVAGGDTVDALVEALQPFAPNCRQRPRLQQLTVVLIGPDPEHAPGAVPALREALSGCRVLPVQEVREVGLELLGESAFDAVILDHPTFWDGDNPNAVLDRLVAVTEPNAWLAVRAPGDQAILDHGEWETRGSFAANDYLLRRRRGASPALDAVVYVLTAAAHDLPDRIHEEMADVLGARIELVGIDHAPDLTDQVVISLVELDRAWVAHWAPEEIHQFQALLGAKHLLWVSRCPEAEARGFAGAGATTGLLRTVRNENPGLALPQLLLAENEQKDLRGMLRGIARVLQLTLQPGSRPRDWEFYVQDGRLLVPRAMAYTPLDESMDALSHGPRPALAELAHDKRPLRLRTESPDLKDARWEVDDRVQPALADDQVEVQLHSVSISDPTGKKGLVPEARIAAVEALGTVHQVGASVGPVHSVGDEVVCVVPSHAWPSVMATRVRLPATAVWNLPPRQTRLQSLSTPIAYAAAYTSLFGGSRAAGPSSVLILGSVSQTLRAVVDCALAAGMQVYVALDGDAAVTELCSQYPLLHARIGAIHPDLDVTVSRLTSGQGVELSVCCLGGAASRIAASCLAPGGRLVDLSEDMNLAALPRSILDRGCTVSAIRLSRMLQDRPRQVQANFHRAVDLLSGKVTLGHVQPYPVFPIARLADATAHARTTGTRVILDLQAPGKVPIVPALPDPPSLPAENTYLLVGGLGTLGLALATTLVECGARHLVFLTRSGTVPSSSTHHAALQTLQTQGARTDIIRCDASRHDNIQALVSHAQTQDWRIRGIVQCATVLRDTMFSQMDSTAWTQSTDPKIRGTWNLHAAFLTTPLDFFVTLSSVASVIGNMGQANYAAGNAYMDALMRWRRHHDLAGHSINIGLVPDASGTTDVAESADLRRHRYAHLAGTDILRRDIQSLFRVIVQNIVPVPPQVIAGMTDTLPRTHGAATWQFDRKFDHRVQLVADDDTGVVTTSTLLKQAPSLEDALRVVHQALQEYLARAMAAAPDSIDLELPFSALGVDSLKAAEVQNWVRREMGAELSSFEFIGSRSVRVLADKIVAGSSFVGVTA
ncbi:polyketide synthase [Aspergillus sclerotiicarbonarius CBS 121057]|uniref:Polyketide synthase n=1 Tax=Aspergillus sclerotiicarbonarius (strain CBS 121057 / IBT 28362) TaxID=1448318 RepID=A0A319EM00_ASPSB|nr:polyketide synthase [Aspergillus sclerotiicarbonarius CBS 121057]